MEMTNLKKYEKTSSIITQEIDFKVSAIPAKNPISGKDIPGLFINYREDNSEFFGVVKSRYKIFQHTDILKNLQENYFSKISNEYLVKNYLAPGKVYTTVLFPLLSVGKDKETAIPGFSIRNSYDGSSSLLLQALMLKLVCTNGMMRESYSFDYSFQHSINSEIKENVLEKIYNMVKLASGDYAYLHDNLAQLPAIEKEQLPEIFSERLQKKAVEVMPIENAISGNNRWAQYGSFTRVISNKDINPALQENQLRKITDFFYNSITV